jgi:DNA-binding NarL/FixJ family response regulator
MRAEAEVTAMGEQHTNGIILLVDALELRRACSYSVFRPWAQSMALDLVALPPEKILSTKLEGKVELVVINLGGASLSDRMWEGLFTTAKRDYCAPYVLISDSCDPDDAIAAAELDFQAFLPTTLSLEIVKQALIFVLGGGTYFPREALLAHPPSRAILFSGKKITTSSVELTARQYEVLERLRFGKSNKHIARELNMQEATVKVHVRQIMRKLGAANRTQAALLARTAFDRTPEIADVDGIPPLPIVNGTPLFASV